jgi:hypothetical protein
LTITRPSRAASSIARADFPLAVGPASRTGASREMLSIRMPELRLNPPPFCDILRPSPNRKRNAEGAMTETATKTDAAATTYSRVMLKISGEALMGDQGYGLHPPTVNRIAEEVKSVRDMGVEICMVIGGGNIFRGLQGSAQGWSGRRQITWACWRR